MSFSIFWACPRPDGRGRAASGYASLRCFAHGFAVPIARLRTSYSLIMRYLTILFLFCCNTVFSQHYTNKLNAQWACGYDFWGQNEPQIGKMFIDTNTDTLQVSILENIGTGHEFFMMNTSICDMSGNLVCYSNGMHIFNAAHQIIENGDSLPQNEYFYTNGDYVFLNQGVLLLPAPGHENQYYLLHEEVYPPNEQVQIYVMKCYTSLIDMAENNGAGKVLERNTVLIDDTLDIGKISACRHANGRDWWVVVPAFYSNHYYTYLLDTEGFHFVSEQVIGIKFPYDAFSNIVFTPDGTKMIRGGLEAYYHSNLSVFDFDRCTGLLSNPRNFGLPVCQNENLQNECIQVSNICSSNSRFLYAMAHHKVWQFDLWQDNIEESRLEIAVWDSTFWDVFPVWFGFSNLAPNGKIYIGTFGATGYLHVINHPNGLGAACDFQQHAISLPYPNYSMPNHVNHTLGALDGSPCDTLGLDAPVAVHTPPPVQQQVKVYPNPTTEYFMVSFEEPQQGATITLTNALGEVVLQHSLQSMASTVWVKDLAAGVYFYSIEKNEKVLQSGKVVKL